MLQQFKALENGLSKKDPSEVSKKDKVKLLDMKMLAYRETQGKGITFEPSEINRIYNRCFQKLPMP
eukprot:3028547-Alexandrium_andersonii.AAC.1